MSGAMWDVELSESRNFYDEADGAALDPERVPPGADLDDLAGVEPWEDECPGLLAGFHQGVDVIVYLGVGIEDVLKIRPVDHEEDGIFQRSNAIGARPACDQGFFTKFIPNFKHAEFIFFFLFIQNPDAHAPLIDEVENIAGVSFFEEDLAGFLRIFFHPFSYFSQVFILYAVEHRALSQECDPVFSRDRHVSILAWFIILDAGNNFTDSCWLGDSRVQSEVILC